MVAHASSLGSPVSARRRARPPARPRFGSASSKPTSAPALELPPVSGRAFDSAVIESFWGRMQTDLLNRRRWRTRV